MTMKKSTILSIMLLFVLSSVAGNRSKKEMRDIAASALATYGVSGKVTRAHSVVEPKLESETPQYAIYSDEVGGFVIVSKRDDVRPVLGRSLGKYDAAKIPDGLQWWMQATEAALKSGARASEDADIMNVDEPIDNFITAEWNQLLPYNQHCPTDNNDNRCVTGCVATAMAMAMNYFKYPAAGTGTGCYSVKSSVEGANPVVETFDNVPIDGKYQWDRMKDTYTSYDTAEELATLMFDCGKAVGMAYSANESSATSVSIPHALAYNFGYDSLAVNYYMRDFLSDKDWFTLLRNELSSKRPVFFGGMDQTGAGHQFLLTGINTDGTVYVNWGWGGNGNGWFAIDHLVYRNKYDFAYDQDITIGMNPLKTPAEGTENTSLLAFFPQIPISLSTSAKNEILLSNFAIFNSSWRVFHGTFKMIVETEEETPKAWEVDFFDEDETAYMQYGYGYSYTRLNSLNKFLSEDGITPYEFPEGFYKLYFVSKSNEESNWQFVRKPGGNPYCYFSVAADGTVKVDNENSLSGIRDVISDPASNAPTSMYSISGSKLASPSQSNIVIMKNGKDVRKVIVNR